MVGVIAVDEYHEAIPSRGLVGEKKLGYSDYAVYAVYAVFESFRGSSPFQISQLPLPNCTHSLPFLCHLRPLSLSYILRYFEYLP